MATIESKNLLVWVKAMSRGQNLPLDASEIYDSYVAAETYAGSSAIAYAGQTVKALLEDGKYHSYTLQPSEAGYTLEEIGAVSSADLKQYVQVVETLPTIGQEQGVIYINTTDSVGSIWNGTAWIEVFRNVQPVIDEIQENITVLQSDMESKAPLANPAFTGTVTVDGETIALKSYVDGLFANMKSTAPGLVDSINPLPVVDYEAGQTFRVAEAGEYAGQKCEIGDLIIVVSNYNVDTASDSDFIVVQANIEGAVTSAAEVATVGEIVVYDSVTGKVIRGAGINISSLNEVIAKAHEHENEEILNSYDKSQTDLLATAKAEAQTLVDGLSEVVDGKADKATTLAGYGITDAYTRTEADNLLTPITENLNTKVDATTVDSKITTAKEEILEEAATSASEALEARIGDIPSDTSVKTYIDNAIGSGGTSSAEAIAVAKQEAIDTSKAYTDEQIANALTVVEF